MVNYPQNRPGRRRIRYPVAPEVSPGGGRHREYAGADDLIDSVNSVAEQSWTRTADVSAEINSCDCLSRIIKPNGPSTRTADMSRNNIKIDTEGFG